MLSSYPVYIGSVERRIKNKVGSFEMLKLPRPSAVENYNKIMGGCERVRAVILVSRWIVEER